MSVSTKLFHLFTSNFNKDEYSELKEHFNGVFKSELNRPLKQGNLDNVAARLLGANTPNTMADVLNKQQNTNAFENIYASYVAMADTEDLSHIRQLKTLPIIHIDVITNNSDKVRLTFSIDLSLIGEDLESSIHFNSIHDIPEDTELDYLVDAGGCYLHEALYPLFHHDNADNLSEFFRRNDVISWRADVSDLVTKKMGINKVMFHNLKETRDLIHALNNINNIVFFDVYSSMAKQGYCFGEVESEDSLTLKASKFSSESPSLGDLDGELVLTNGEFKKSVFIVDGDTSSHEESLLESELLDDIQKAIKSGKQSGSLDHGTFSNWEFVPFTLGIKDISFYRKQILRVGKEAIWELLDDNQWDNVSDLSSRSFAILTKHQMSEYRLSFDEDGLEHEGALCVYLRLLTPHQLKAFVDRIIPSQWRDEISKAMEN